MYRPCSHITDTGKQLSNDTQQFIFHKYPKALKNSTNCHFEDIVEIGILGKPYPAEPLSAANTTMMWLVRNQTSNAYNRHFCVDRLFKSTLQEGGKQVLKPLPDAAGAGTTQDLRSASPPGGHASGRSAPRPAPT